MITLNADKMVPNYG